MTGLSVGDDISDEFLGKDVADLQTGVTFGANGITGTLKYITGWTAFSGDEAEQSGNYLVLKAELDGADLITAQLINGKSGRGVIELDDDGILVARITDKDRQMIQIVAYKDGMAQQKLYRLSGLTLEAAS